MIHKLQKFHELYQENLNQYLVVILFAFIYVYNPFCLLHNWQQTFYLSLFFFFPETKYSWQYKL